ncbi:MAG: methionine synthase [Phycisphaerales bacterium]
MSARFIDHLARRVLIFDGAMGTATHELDLDVDKDYWGCENCTDVLALSRPDAIRQIHASYLEAGADCVETDTFGGMPHVLAEFDLADRAEELCRAAAEIARSAADEYSTDDKPRFVIGSLGPGTKLGSLGQITWRQLHDSYAVAASGLIAGGADAFIIETCQDPMQVKAVINACLTALEKHGKTPDDVPILVSLTIETMGTMLVGTSIEAACTILRGYPIAGLSLNCATGPTEMAEALTHMSKHWAGAIGCIPNAGLPVLVDGRADFPLRAPAFAAALGEFVEKFGLGYVGGCCGTTAAHIRELAKTVGVRAPRAREIEMPAPSTSSLFSPTEHRQDASVLLIGERCNASGSRAFKKLLEAEDWEGVVSLARQQVREGAHVLDVNVDYAGRDNARDMREIVSRMAREVDAPVMVDSTQAKNFEAGLEAAPGKCIINSANFENGEDHFDAVCAIAKRHNAALVIGTIDEDPEHAMARTADRKVAIAARAIERATTVHGLAASDLFIDPLVLPVSTGMDTDRRSAAELVEGTRRISERFPEVQITCGLSNASFGLNPAARVVLNSVLLHELEQAGLTSAIVHAGKIVPLARIEDAQREAALAVIYDKRHESKGGTGLPEGVTDEDFDPLQHLIDLFVDVKSVTESGPKLSDMALEERLRHHIIEGEKDGLAASLEEAMTKYTPLAIINDHLLEGMKTVGELFGAGEMQLPFVLRSAEVMKTAVAHLEPHMDRVEGETKGSIVLATVKGDVHDIGKNLVDIILTNNGYTVHNLGIKQPISAILEALESTKADAVGLSGLLVKSVNVMEENLRELNERGIRVPVLLGGAALSRSYAEGYLRDIYEGSLLYGKDAFEGLRIMDHLASGRLDAILTEITDRQAKRSDARRAHDERVAAEGGRGQAVGAAGVASTGERSDVARDNAVPEPPFWGSRVVEDIPITDVFAYINPTALFSVQWQIKRGRKTKEEHERELDEVARPVFERLKRRAIAEGFLTPKVVYGYFPCYSDGDDLVVLDPDARSRELERFTFPRQTTRRGLCISDFFKDRAECESLGRHDVLALSCVTVGRKVSELAAELFKGNDYAEYLYVHGLGVESAEGLAEMWHKRIRQELGFGHEDGTTMHDLFQQHYRGSRYSFGYPACPDMSDQEKLWRLIDPTRIGCELTENWQIDPEQSTSAIVAHHPQAKYFNA